MVTPEELQKAAETIRAGIAGYAGESLTNREFLRFILDFANGKRGEALTGPLTTAPDVLALPALPSVDRETGKPLESRRTQFVESHRAELREHLALSIGRRALPPETFKALSQAALLMLDPVSGYEFKRTTKGAKQRYLHASRFYIPLKLSAILAHGVLMLADERLGLGAALKRCALSTCGNFFLAPEVPRGRPKLFCQPAHMQEKHRATGPQRTAKWRAKHK
jgi:hypothetical protein